MKLTMRSLTKADIRTIASAFMELGWSDRTSTLEQYLAEQIDNQRMVFVAEWDNQFAGYVTVKWVSNYLPFTEHGIPEIKDLNVLPLFRRRGIATALLDKAEEIISQRTDRVGIAVGMYSDYGMAQRLYPKRGYVPDGRGLFYHGVPIKHGQIITVDDDLVLYLTKSLHD